MADKKEPTLAEEANLPDSWHEVESTPINPAAGQPPGPNGMMPFFDGSISPTMQHDSIFTKTKYGTPNIPALPLMPVSQSGIPTLVSAIQSVVKSITTTTAAAVTGGNMNWRGDWVSTLPYSVFDVVQFNKSTYLALVGNTNVEPDTNTTDWVLVSENFVYKGVWGAGSALLNPHLNFNDSSGQISGTSTAVYTRSPSFPTWVANTVTAAGYKIVDSNGNLQVATVAGTTKGGLHPVWATTNGATTVDNTVTWTCGGVAHIIEVGDTIISMVWCTSNPTSVTDSMGNTFTSMGSAVTVTPTVASGASRFSYQPSYIRFFKATATTALVSGASYVTTANFSGAANLDIFTFGASNADLVDQYGTTAVGFMDLSTFASYPAPTTTVVAASSELLIAAALLTASTGSPASPWINAGSLAFSIGVSPTGNFGFVQAVYQNAPPSVDSATWLQGFQNYAYGTIIFGLASTAGRFYLPYDVVLYNGSTYVCIVQTTTAPTDTAHWVLLSQGTGTTVTLTGAYAPTSLDIGKLLSNSTASSYTVTLPSPPPINSFWLSFEQSGTGTLIINPNGLLIDGSSSNLTLNQNQGVVIFSDGINYYTMRGMGGGAGPIPGSGANLTAQNANIASTSLYSVGALQAGLYRVSIYTVISQAATTSSTLPDSRIIFTDRDSGSSITIQATRGLTTNTLATFAQASYIVNAKASTNISFDVGQVDPYASVGATPMLFAFRARVEFLT